MPLSKTLTITGNSTTTVNSPVWVVDQWANPQAIGVGVTITGAVTYSLQGAYDDFSPQWDLVHNTATWDNITNFTALTAAANGSVTGGPFTMLRLSMAAGTGTVTAKFLQAYAGHTV